MSSGVKQKNKSNNNVVSKILYSAITGIVVFIILLAVSSLLILNILIPDGVSVITQ